MNYQMSILLDQLSHLPQQVPRHVPSVSSPSMVSSRTDLSSGIDSSRRHILHLEIVQHFKNMRLLTFQRFLRAKGRNLDHDRLVFIKVIEGF
jgi:hypothetical protein